MNLYDRPYSATHRFGRIQWVKSSFQSPMSLEIQFVSHNLSVLNDKLIVELSTLFNADIPTRVISCRLFSK
jgi:hypothetical protein